MIDNVADFLIIGGGTAGSVLAARLSEDAGTRVLLLEAGCDVPPNAIPGDIDDVFPSSFLNAKYFWPALRASGVAGSEAVPFKQARIMGGGSSVMGMWALRGIPSDYDNWRNRGAIGWGWNDVEPYFRQLENDSDCSPHESASGPVPLRRLPFATWPGFIRTIQNHAMKASALRGSNVKPAEHNGFFAMPLFQNATVRSSNIRCYLTSAVRRRDNLTIVANVQVSKLCFDGTRVTAVKAKIRGQDRTFHARQIIVSAGAIHSPALLLRSGIGCADELAKVGITPIVDRRGVGRNLQNHVFVHFGLTVAAPYKASPEFRGYAVAGWRQSSGTSSPHMGDLLLAFIARVSTRRVGSQIGLIAAALMSPTSRGSVTLTVSGDRYRPCVAFNCLNDPGDRERFIAVARRTIELLHDSEVAKTYLEAFLLPPAAPLHHFNQTGLLGASYACLGQLLMGSPTGVRRAIFRRVAKVKTFIDPQREVVISDDEILAAASPMFHPSGTCAIGNESDKQSVVDTHCKVYGVDNLRVIDASVMPQIPSGNTNLPTLMIAERASDLIRHANRAH